MSPRPSVRLHDIRASLAERGHPLPVAVTHAVVVALLDAAPGEDAPSVQTELVIDDRGQVHSGPRAGGDIAKLAVELLGGDGETWPASAQPLRPVLEAAAAGNGDVDLYRLRLALRRHLVPPAAPDELRRWAELARLRENSGSDEAGPPPSVDGAPTTVEAVAASPSQALQPESEPVVPPLAGSGPLEPRTEPEVPSGIPTMPPPSEPSPSLLELEEALEAEDRAAHTELLPARPDTKPPEPVIAKPSLDLPASPEEAAALRPAGEVLEEIAASGQAREVEPAESGSFSPSGRPVVRHELPRSDPPVMVSSAPAARRSARPATDGHDSLLGPGSDRAWMMWLVVLLALAGAMYLLFFS